MDIDSQALFAVLNELYPRELNHAIAEVRARTAEARSADLEKQLGKANRALERAKKSSGK